MEYESNATFNRNIATAEGYKGEKNESLGRVRLSHSQHSRRCAETASGVLFEPDLTRSRLLNGPADWAPYSMTRTQTRVSH